MLKLMRNVYNSKNVLTNKSVTGLSINRIGEKYFYSTRTKVTSDESNLKKNSETVEKTKEKNLPSPKVTVISTDLKLSLMTLEEASKLSKRRNLKLVKITDRDHKTQRPVYKLMTGTEYFQEDLNHRKEKSLRKNSETKDPKLLTLTSNIGQHDLESKIKNMIKWLNKRHEVRIVINVGGKNEAAERIAQTIETETKAAGKMVQKRRKGEDIKFQLLSLKKKQDDAKDKPDDESEAVKTNEET